MLLSSQGIPATRLRKDPRIRRKSVIHRRLNQVAIDIDRGDAISCQFHSTGDYILWGNDRGEIYITDTDGSSKSLAILKGHKEYISAVRFSRDESEIYSISSDKTIRVWDSMRGTMKSKVTGHTDFICCMDIARNGPHLLCTGAFDQDIRMWDLRERMCILKSETASHVRAISFSDCGNYVFSGGNHEGLDVRDLRMINRRCEVNRGPCSDILGMKLSPCGEFLAVCDIVGIIKWEVNDLKHNPGGRYRYFHRTSRVLGCCAWSADGTMMTAKNGRLNTLVIDTSNSDTVRRLEPHGCIVNDVAFHPHKRVLMTAAQGLVLHDF